MENKTTLVIGASENPDRYSNMAIRLLRKHNFEVTALAKRNGKVCDVSIQTEFPEGNIHTVTLYIGRHRQAEYYSKIITLNPKRVIFNPGTENPELYTLLGQNGIEAVKACTLFLLSSGQY